MKYFLLTIFLFCHWPSFGQDSLLRKQIDELVLSIDKADGKTSTFKISSTYYQYKIINGKLSKIESRLKKGSIKTIRIFYIKNSSLILSTEKEITYFGNDSITWGGGFYFKNGKLIDYETLGHGKSEDENWKPEIEVIANYNKAKKVVSVYIRSKKP